MAKSTTTYWNALAAENQERWTPVVGLDGIAEELTLSMDALAVFLTDPPVRPWRKDPCLPGGGLHRQWSSL